MNFYNKSLNNKQPLLGFIGRLHLDSDDLHIQFSNVKSEFLIISYFSTFDEVNLIQLASKYHTNIPPIIYRVIHFAIAKGFNHINAVFRVATQEKVHDLGGQLTSSRREISQPKNFLTQSIHIRSSCVICRTILLKSHIVSVVIFNCRQENNAGA